MNRCFRFASTDMTHENNTGFKLSRIVEYLQDTGERLVDWWWRSHSLDQLLISP